MAYLQRASPALKDTLLSIYRTGKSLEIDHHFCEFGSVEYRVTCSVSEPRSVYLSTSASPASEGISVSDEIAARTAETLKGIAFGVVDVVEPPKEGFQLTLKLNFDKLPRGKGALKIINKISEIQAIIVSSHLKEILGNVENAHDGFKLSHKPIKVACHPGEPFYVVKQPGKITAIFPMRFKEDSDVVIATTFFQELVEASSEKDMLKAPQCSWSPIPPPELRGEPFPDLNTNAGFVSFDILPRHVKERKLEKTVWNLLSFSAYVKYHIKCTKGFIQRRIRKKMGNLVQVLGKMSLEEDGEIEVVDENARCKYVRKLVKLSKPVMVRKKYIEVKRRVRRTRFRIKINGCDRFRQRWLSFPNITSYVNSYAKLD